MNNDNHDKIGRVIICVGGSATNDAGFGMANAFQIKFNHFDDNEKDEIVIETAVKVDAVDKEEEAVDDTAPVQEIVDESESLEEEITVEESSEDVDKDLPDEIVVDESQDDSIVEAEEPKSESN